MLYVATCAALRAAGPATVTRWARAVASRFPALDEREACVDERRLRRLARVGVGACLPRAIVVSARLPGSVVVIGARAPSEPGDRAHAWVERGATRIGDDEAFRELARL